MFQLSPAARLWRRMARIGYSYPMSLFLRRVARYAAQKVAADPRVREKAVEAARFVADEAKLIARDQDRARAAGRSFRRALNLLQSHQESGRDDQPEKLPPPDRRD